MPSQEKSYENIYYTLSQVCSQLNELEEAKNYLKKHLSIFSKDCEALLLYTNLQLKTREIEEVEKNYKKILSIDNNYLPVIY